MSDRLTFAPIELTLYGEDDEVKARFSKSVIRWNMMKRAIKLAKEIDDANALDEDTFDSISNFICALFGDQFTREELEAGAEVGEIMACFRMVVRRASAAGNA